MRPVIVLFLLAFLSGCEEPEKTILPKKPESAASVSIQLRNKEYKTDRIGFMPANEKDTLIEWVDEAKDTSQYNKDFLQEMKEFKLKIRDEKMLELTEKNRSVDAQYILDETNREGEDPGIYLRLQFSDSTDKENPADSSGRRINTYSYQVRGIDGRKLLLQLPRTSDNRPIIVMMKSKDATGKD